MIFSFTKKAALLRRLNDLLFYNDKGVELARHNESQASNYRAQALHTINELVKSMPDEQFPPEFLLAIHTGSLGEDYAGRYVDLIRQHFRLQA